MDQEYTFYAGMSYFIKQGRIDVIQDVDVEAMRDDEWVFSGYSFDEALWIDRAGRLHEGPVPPDQAEALWGVGFRHKTSKDAFLAVWLEHSAEGFDAIGHNGSPNLHYDGHGQLWSRYPVQKARLKAGTVLRQRNAYSIEPFEEQGGARRVEELRHQLLHPVEVSSVGVEEVVGRTAETPGSLARSGEDGGQSAIKREIWRVLREVQDEQLYTVDANVVDLGLVYDVQWRAGTVKVLLTMPHRGRPVVDFFVSQGGGRVSEGIRERLSRLDGVRDVVVELTWEPSWTSARLTDAGRRALGLGDA
jgi:metal-sulfur cluster biosynthetic enzyme